MTVRDELSKHSKRNEFRNIAMTPCVPFSAEALLSYHAAASEDHITDVITSPPTRTSFNLFLKRRDLELVFACA